MKVLIVLVGDLKNTGGPIYFSIYGINYRYDPKLKFQVLSSLDQYKGVKIPDVIIVFHWGCGGC